MKKKSLILIAAVAGIIALFMLPWYGLDKVGSFIGPFLYLVFLITVGAIIIDYLLSGLQWVSRIAEQKIKQQKLREDEVKASIKLLNERSRIIEKKIDKINGILSKVSD